MELTTLYKRVVGLDVHQAKITACAITEDEAGNVGVELAEFGGFKRDRKALASGWPAIGPKSWSWRARGSTGRVPMSRWRRSASSRRWSMPGM